MRLSIITCVSFCANVRVAFVIIAAHCNFNVFVVYRLRLQIFNVNKNPTDATVCKYLFTAKLLYMFRLSQHPSSEVLKTVPATSGTGHTTSNATPLLRGLIWTGLCESTRLAQTSPDQTT